MNVNSITFAGANNYHKPYHVNARNNLDVPIPNFSKVDDVLLRGAQPNQTQIQNLKKQGVGVVVNLRTLFVSGLPFDEKKVVEDVGMKYENIPIVTKSGPSIHSVEKFFAIVDKAKERGQKVFLHCMAGQDRTGSMTALYKIDKGIDTPERAFNEMIDMGHNQKMYPKLIDKLKLIVGNLK